MDIATLVNTLVLIAKSAKLTESQSYEVIGRFTSAILSEAVGDRREEPTPPPRKVDKVKTKEELDPGGVVVPRGTVCTCEVCQKPVYQVAVDVTERMKISAFIAAYKPIGDAKPMDTLTDIWGDPYGNAAVDCPLCKGRKTLWIKGRGDKTFDEYPSGSQDTDINA